jgi:hypothetical protein
MPGDCEGLRVRIQKPLKSHCLDELPIAPSRRSMPDCHFRSPEARIVPADESITSNPLFAQAAAQSAGVTHVVEQPLLPLVSYPSEWSFEMLRDAALLTLQIQSELVERGLSLKDATAFNNAH